LTLRQEEAMAETRYTKDHEYIRIEGETGTVGISDYAQGQLGDVVFVELPEIGKALSKGGEAAVVESVKAASEVYAPVSGEVVEVNSELEAAPGTVNEDPAGKGWFLKIKLKDAAELESLMSEAEYQDYVKSL
jgi:glycine cleavage system H protein